MLEYFDKQAFLSGDMYRQIDCESPRLIYNPYKRERQFVACRECRSCKMKRSSRLADLLAREVRSSAYSVFFTLTYDNDHLNKWSVSIQDVEFTDSESGEISLYPAKVLTEDTPRHGDESLKFFTSKDDFVPPIRVWSNGKPHVIPNTFASVNVRDIQLFLKRLRRRLQIAVDKYNLENHAQESSTIRYFIAAEYGPKSYRPHYHGIIFTSSAFVAKLLTDRPRRRGSKEPNNFIYKSWNMCNFDRIKPSIAKGEKAARYCSEYLCSTYNLPSILRSKPFRPFYVCSRKPFIGYNSIDEEEIFGRFMSGSVASPEVSETGVTSYLPLSLSIFDHFFPLPACSSSTSDQSKLLLYEKYRDKKFRVSGSSYNLISEHGNLLDLSPIGAHFSTDAYNYQDARFAAAVSYWCNRTVTFKEFSFDGRPTGRVISRIIDPKEYIRLLGSFHKRYEYFHMVEGYSRMESLCSSGLLIDNELKRLCDRYFLDPEDIVPLFWYRNYISLLPEVAFSYDNLIHCCPWLESIGSAVYILYNHDDVFFGDEYCFDYLESQYTLRKDLFDYIVQFNPLTQRQLDNTVSLFHLKSVYKMHLDTFNSL